ncbi:MAG: hypothetical protein M3R24_27210 [Chloroflexota bacterium]|nr:hypothetical protein [Chloroflexota bacterium]
MDGPIFGVRWAVIGLVTVITVLDPIRGHTGHRLWQLALLFAAYNLRIVLLHSWLAWLRVPGVIAGIDLLVAGSVYLIDHEP